MIMKEIPDVFLQQFEDTANTILENNLENIYTGNAEVIPTNANVLIQPYEINPYRNIETTASGIVVGVESSKTYKSNETGEIEQNQTIIKVGKVLMAGPACKNVNVGDDVFYTTFSETKIPFRKKGYVVVSETLIICRIIRK